MRKIQMIQIRFVVQDESRGAYMFVGQGATFKEAVQNAISKRKNPEEIEVLKGLFKELK
jgi:hypothetical protein